MRNFVTSLLGNEKLVTLGIFFISAIAIISAFTAEYVYDIPPCILCLFQRIPYAVAGLLSLAAFFVSFKSVKAVSVMMFVISGVFATDSVIAFYHTGVEQKWWKSFLEACKAPDISGSAEDILKAIESAPVARCDEIPWQDPIMGLSMANYNVIICAGLFLITLMSAIIIRRKAGSR